MIPRRGLMAGLGALLAAPAIIRTPGLLMPVKPPPLAAGVDWTFFRDAPNVHFPPSSGLEEWLHGMAARIALHPPVYALLPSGQAVDITDRLPTLIGGKG